MWNWMIVIMGAELVAAQQARQSLQAQPPEVQRPCAIPLINVLKPLPGAAKVTPDPMIIVPGGPARYSKEEVQVPAPSCEDRKK